MTSDSVSVSAHITPYDRLSRSEFAFTQLLAAERESATLIDFFGAPLHAELTTLAKAAVQAKVRGNRRVYVLPGIMGSQLGVLREAPKPPDVLWIDPIDIALGRLPALALSADSPVVPLGVLLYGHLKLQLSLRAAGYDSILWDYDWRRGVDALGDQLAAALRADPASDVAIVAHSLGGLVARRALTHAIGAKVSQLIMMGTPQFGSLAAVQALRGTYSVVRKVAMLDPKHDAESLATRVFRSFESLYHLLPPPGRAGALDLFALDSWPTNEPRPDGDMLARSAGLEQLLAPPDARFTSIIGHGRATPTAVSRTSQDFVYDYTFEGDGTVPTACAELPGARSYYVDSAHSDLPRSSIVIDSVVDLLRDGITARLQPYRVARQRARVRWSDRELRALHTTKIDWTALTPEERRRFLDSLNEPPVSIAAPTPTRVRRAARATQPKLRVAVEVGDVGKFSTADVLAVATFRGVRPRGAVAALDAALQGAITELYEHRMLSADLGVITPVPALRRLGKASAVLLAGLGTFDQLSTDNVRLAAANVGRWCQRNQLRHLAVSAWGSGSGLAIELACSAQLQGILESKDPSGRSALERITFVVRDASTAQRVRERLLGEIDAGLGSERGVDIRLVARRSERRRRRDRLDASSKPRLTYLWIDSLTERADTWTWRAALLTAGREAAVISHACAFERQRLDRLVERLQSSALTTATVRAVGAAIPRLTLHESLLKAVRAVKGQALAVVHDGAASYVPWETFNIGGWFPALTGGLSRRLQSSDLVPARFDANRREADRLSVLLIANPTSDLPGAEVERARVAALLAQHKHIELVEVRERAATLTRIVAELESGRYDVVHYAGHAFFDAARPETSGLVLADGHLTGSALAGLTRLPPLVFFNACESGRVRLRRDPDGVAHAESSRRESARRNVGLAETLLRAGVANYIGTHWPVGDAAASEFASVLYARLLKRDSIGDAMLAARRAVHALRSPDWADYIHYGDPEFELKTTR